MKNIFPLIEQNISPQELLGPVLHQPWPPLSHFPPLMARTQTPWKLCSSWLPMVANVLYPPPTLPAPSRSLTRGSSAINQMNLRKTKRWVLKEQMNLSYQPPTACICIILLWDEQPSPAQSSPAQPGHQPAGVLTFSSVSAWHSRAVPALPACLPALPGWLGLGWLTGEYFAHWLSHQ